MTFKPLIAAAWLLAGAAMAADLPVTEGEVRRVNSAGQEVTIKHGEIKNLDMPPMTMVFKVKDPAQLSALKAGDKVRFTADQINGAYTVLSIERAP
ncbi:MAG: copper-binding protein [Hydrogenophaga sp.]|uniref:copper-binding protein n=1 Tax=Hydrogenophaga sp. TaxID=1904254 RepID=UPI001D7B943A|nr:copper-binding protein [Hydrogenophaga sp.]MBX3610427.1 copper-binding protein [Hydrogenophaga sp.]